jgi:MFS family permease
METKSASTYRLGELLRLRPYAIYLLTRGCSSAAYQIAAVAVGWQLYALTHSAFDLGMLGLAQFVPAASLTFFAGHVADRYQRQTVVRLCQLAQGLAALFLAWGSFAGWLDAREIFITIMVIAGARSFEAPASSALVPAIVPPGALQKATAISSSIFQMATIVGPALGGLLYTVNPGVPYAVMTICLLGGASLVGFIKTAARMVVKEPPTLNALFAGVGFVWRAKAILGTISLDLFAVLLGGATALLPVYAHDILHTGPWGLGLLRGAPALGALVTTALITRSPFGRKVGLRMFQSVIAFGLATIVFGVSRELWLSTLALIALGAADMVSVVIRLSLVQLQTPDDMRGRVGAVNYLFINASNQLGEFESGVTAALFGAVPAVVIGGVGTVMIALLWMRLFPALKNVERLE